MSCANQAEPTLHDFLTCQKLSNVAWPHGPMKLHYPIYMPEREKGDLGEEASYGVESHCECIVCPIGVAKLAIVE